MRLLPVEQNYNIGNQEHWLEGALHPFSVLTDHRNLKYFKAKRLNFGQAQRALPSLVYSNLWSNLQIPN